MYLVTHTALSLVIGNLIQNPLLAFVLAFVFHLLADLIPHDIKLFNKSANRETKIKVFSQVTFIDMFLIFILLFTLWQVNKLNLSLSLVLAIIGGILPDFLWGFDELTKGKIKFLNNFHKFHHWWHKLFYKKVYIQWWLACIVQILFFIFFIVMYLKIF